jgi:hypothetical protein
MNHYTVKLIFRIICGEGKHAVQFDEQFRLIEAHDESEAIQRATLFAMKQEEDNPQTGKYPVKWEFVGVTEVSRLPELKNGSELYSSVKEVDDEKEYMQIIKERVRMMQVFSLPSVII